MNSVDDSSYAEIKALLDEILAVDKKGNRLLPDSDLHPMTKCLEQVVKENAVVIAYDYILSDTLLENELRREEKKPPRSVLTVKEAAEELRCSQTAVRDMIKSGRLKAMEIGTGTQRKVYKIRRSDLDTLAKIHREHKDTPSSRRSRDLDGSEYGL